MSKHSKFLSHLLRMFGEADDHDEDADGDHDVMMDAFRHIMGASSGTSIPKQIQTKNAMETTAKRMPITCASMLGSFSSDACIQIPTKLWPSCVKLPRSAAD